MNSNKFKTSALALLALVAGCNGDSSNLAEEATGIGTKLCSTAAPTIASVGYATEPGESLRKQDIVYISGESITITLDASLCTQVREVRWGADVIGGDVDPIEGSSRSYDVASTSTATGDRHAVTLHLPNLGEGLSRTVAIDLENSLSGEIVSHTFTLALVAEVATGVRMFFTEESIRNSIVAGFYEKFGDDDRYDADGGAAYDFAWSDLELHINDVGVDLALSFKLAIENYCDPQISLSGRFHLEHDSSGVVTVWDNGPNADIDFPLLCDVSNFLLGGGMTFAISMFEGSAEEDFGAEVERSVVDAFGDCGGLGCGVALTSLKTHPGMLAATVKVPFDQVKIRVPYNTRRPESPAFYGVAIPMDEPVTLVPGGVASACAQGGHDVAGDCGTYPVTPEGLFNWRQNAPVPTPWVLYDGVYAYYKPRHDARALLSGLDRDIARLPMPEQNVASVVAAVGDDTSRTSFHSVGTPCTITPRAGRTDSIGFGMNDYRAGTDAGSTGAEYGSGNVEITLAWIPVDGLRACPTNPLGTQVEDLTR